MESDLVFDFEQVTNMHGQPLPYFEIHGILKNVTESKHIALVSLLPEVRCMNKFNLPSSARFDSDRAMTPGESLNFVRIHVDVPERAVRFIEDARRGESGVELQLVLKAVVSTSGVPPRQWGPPISLKSQVVGNVSKHSNVVTIERDKWCEMLDHFGWDELEVFELHAHELKRTPALGEALNQLKKAVKLMRESDHWEEVLGATRKAFEAAATSTAKTDNTRLAFEELWQGVFPLGRDKKLLEAVDNLTRASADFQHIGRHSKYPFPAVGRREALLGLRITLALFDYLSTRLSSLKET